jgi:SAM-dependent methyltransferase
MFKKNFVYALLFICIGSSADSLSDSPYYQQEAAGHDGISKYYVGREISYVMGHLGSSWLERTTRKQEERTDLLLENMKLRPTDIVIDLGAGTGYFSFSIARKVPDGGVIAVDIQPEMLSIIEQRKTRENIANIETLLTTVSNPNIPESIADVVLLVDAYHEF